MDSVLKYRHSHYCLEKQSEWRTLVQIKSQLLKVEDFVLNYKLSHNCCKGQLLEDSTKLILFQPTPQQ